MESKLNVITLSKRIALKLSVLSMHSTGAYRIRIDHVLSFDMCKSLDDFINEKVCVYDIRQWKPMGMFPANIPAYVDGSICELGGVKCRVIMSYNIANDDYTVVIDFEVNNLTGQ